MHRETSVRGFVVRSTTADDVPTILGFIRALAAVEGLEHEVVATEQDLRTTLFGERPGAEVVLGELGGQPVAFALFFHNYSTFLGRPGLYLEDLYVDDAARGRGIGRVMLQFLAALARERGCGRLEWWVLDDNVPAVEFYRGLGARSMDEWTVQRVDGALLDRWADAFDGRS